MASSPAGEAGTSEAPSAAAANDRQPRRGPAPFASFDHDVSDEVRPDSSPESKLTFQLPEIRENPTSPGGALGVPENRVRSHSSPAVTVSGLRAPPAPRIDISRASSSSHQDSRDSSPDMALFPSELAFREEGALDLRSSTEELAFLEGAPTAQPAAPPTTSITAPSSRRHSRKDSQGSEIALLTIGRTDRLASVGSQSSAISRLSRTPSPHRMLLETSFCGPRPLDNEPDLCENRLLQIANVVERRESAPAPLCPAPPRPCEVRAEVTIEALPSSDDKQSKEWRNRAVAAESRRARSRPTTSSGDTRDIIRIRLKPNHEYDDDDDDPVQPCEAPNKPATLQIRTRCSSPTTSTPQRKASFASLFRTSPESPGGARSKKSLSEGRPRSTSRDRASGLRGSVLSLFRSSRRSAVSPPPPSFVATPSATKAVPAISPAVQSERLKYYEETRDGIIHIPLRTPPEGDSAVGVVKTASPTIGSQRMPLQRTVLPDGSIIIPLRSPTEAGPERDEIQPAPTSPLSPPRAASPLPPRAPSPPLVSGATEVRATIEQCASPEEVSTRASSRQHVVFRTPMGADGQVFTTQLSVIKTPSISSELSVETPTPAAVVVDITPTTQSVPMISSTTTTPTSLDEMPSVKTQKSISQTSNLSTKPLRKPEDTASKATAHSPEESEATASVEGHADSSESEASSEAGRTRGAEEGERRGLVLGQESFDEELPYVPTTLPLERSLALPMVPVRERGGVRVAAVQRPRPAAPLTGPMRPPPPPPPVQIIEKIRISLPQDSGRGARQRVRSSSVRNDWIDFEEVPERRKQPKRIQTLPRGGSAIGGVGGQSSESVVYVAPENCRCECHHRNSNNSGSSSGECGAEECDRGINCGQHGGSGQRASVARPFTADLDLRPDDQT